MRNEVFPCTEVQFWVRASWVLSIVGLLLATGAAFGQEPDSSGVPADHDMVFSYEGIHWGPLPLDSHSNGMHRNLRSAFGVGSFLEGLACRLTLVHADSQRVDAIACLPDPAQQLLHVFAGGVCLVLAEGGGQDGQQLALVDLARRTFQSLGTIGDSPAGVSLDKRSYLAYAPAPEGKARVFSLGLEGIEQRAAPLPIRALVPVPGGGPNHGTFLALTWRAGGDPGRLVVLDSKLAIVQDLAPAMLPSEGVYLHLAGGAVWLMVRGTSFALCVRPSDGGEWDVSARDLPGSIAWANADVAVLPAGPIRIVPNQAGQDAILFAGDRWVLAADTWKHQNPPELVSLYPRAQKELVWSPASSAERPSAERDLIHRPWSWRSLANKQFNSSGGKSTSPVLYDEASHRPLGHLMEKGIHFGGGHWAHGPPAATLEDGCIVRLPKGVFALQRTAGEPLWIGPLGGALDSVPTNLSRINLWALSPDGKQLALGVTEFIDPPPDVGKLELWEHREDSEGQAWELVRQLHGKWDGDIDLIRFGNQGGELVLVDTKAAIHLVQSARTIQHTDYDFAWSGIADALLDEATGALYLACVGRGERTLIDTTDGSVTYRHLMTDDVGRDPEYYDFVDGELILWGPGEERSHGIVRPSDGTWIRKITPQPALLMFPEPGTVSLRSGDRSFEAPRGALATEARHLGYLTGGPGPDLAWDPVEQSVQFLSVPNQVILLPSPNSWRMFVGARQVNSGAQTVWEVPPILLLRAERGIICEGLPPGKSLEVCLDPGIEDSWQPYLAFTSFRGTDFLFGRLVEQDWTSGSFVVFVR